MGRNLPGITEVRAWPPEVAEVPGEDRERIRLAVLEQILGDEDHRSKVTVARTRELACIDGRKATKVVGAWKRGRSPDVRASWADPIQDAPAAPTTTSVVTRTTPGGESAGPGLDKGLAELARGAVTHEQRDEVLRELAARAIEGSVKPSDADKIRALLGEMRLQGKDKRTVPQEDPERVYLLSLDGARLVSAFERIVSNDRRARAMVLLTEILEEDARELPAVDPVGRL